jgi:20S proteasome subunit beta 2
VSSFVVSTSKLLYKYKGHLGAYLIVGGYDVLGPHLCMVSAEGKYFFFNFSYSYLPFATMGSGSLQAMTVFESKYKDDMTK